MRRVSPSQQGEALRTVRSPAVFIVVAVTALVAPGWLPSALGVLPTNQRDALVSLYSATGGASWTTSTNWLTGDPCTNNWVGVLCSGTTSLAGLDLRSKPLTGTLPTSITAWTGLTALDLSSNSLTGSGIDGVTKLTQLSMLSLNNNLLGGTIPPGITAMVQLTSLDMMASQLSGPIITYSDGDHGVHCAQVAELMPQRIDRPGSGGPHVPHNTNCVERGEQPPVWDGAHRLQRDDPIGISIRRCQLLHINIACRAFSADSTPVFVCLQQPAEWDNADWNQHPQELARALFEQQPVYGDASGWILDTYFSVVHQHLRQPAVWRSAHLGRHLACPDTSEALRDLG